MYSVPRGAAALPEHQRADAVRIAEAQDAVADDHGDHGVTAAAASIDRVDGREDVRRRDARRADALQLGGKHVEQHFGVGLGVQVAAILADQHLGELGGVGQVAVMRQADAVGRVDVERLRLGGGVAAGGRIADVADADIAAQLEHVLLLEHIAHQAGALRANSSPPSKAVMMPAASWPRCCRHGQRIVETLIDRAGADDPDDAAHGASARFCENREVARSTQVSPVVVRRRSTVRFRKGAPRSEARCDLRGCPPRASWGANRGARSLSARQFGFAVALSPADVAAAGRAS